MRLSDFCNRLTTRAPCMPPDSRWQRRLPLDPAVSRPRGPRWTSARPDPPASVSSAFAPPSHADESPGGVSLDGEPPASASPQPPASPEAKASNDGWSSTARSWWRLDRRLLRAVPPDDGVLHRAERAAPPLTSSVASVPLDPIFRPSPRRHPPDPIAAVVSSKTTPSSGPGRLPPTSTLSSTPAHLRRPTFRLSASAVRRPPPAGGSRLRSPSRSLPGPLPARALSEKGHGILEDPPPCSWLCRHEPASSAVFAFQVTPAG